MVTDKPLDMQPATQLPNPSQSKNEFWPKCSGVLGFVSKGRYGYSTCGYKRVGCK